MLLCITEAQRLFWRQLCWREVALILKPDNDDVIKWKHFPSYWPFVWGIHRSPVNSLHKGQWRRPLMFSLVCAWINGWINNGEAGDLRHHRAHSDVTVIVCGFSVIYISMAQCKTAVTPVQMQWSYCSLALSHWNVCELFVCLLLGCLQVVIGHQHLGCPRFLRKLGYKGWVTISRDLARTHFTCNFSLVNQIKWKFLVFGLLQILTAVMLYCLAEIRCNWCIKIWIRPANKIHEICLMIMMMEGLLFGKMGHYGQVTGIVESESGTNHLAMWSFLPRAYSQ